MWIAALTCIGCVLSVHDFLAVNRPIGSGLLIIEGWLPPWALDQVHDIVASGHYSQIVFVEYPGSPTFPEARLSDHRSLRAELGNQQAPVITVRFAPSGHKTYSGALAVKSWSDTQATRVRTADVVTVGVHARKSNFLYRKVLEQDTIEVGIIAAKPRDYDANLWFLSLRGIWLVGRNIVGYSYSVLWLTYSRFLVSDS